MEEDPNWNDRMGTTVSAPSPTVHSAKKTPLDLYYECLDEGEARQFPTPTLFYKINMKARYASVRATVLHYTLPVPIPKKTPLPYGNDSEEESDGPPPSPKKTDATEIKIDKSLQVFIETLPNLEPLHYGFKLQTLNEKGYCFFSLAKCLTPWRKQYHIVIDHSLCGVRLFQGSSLLQHCGGKGDEYYTATACYLTTLFKKEMGLTQASVHHEENDQSRKTVDANKQIFDHYYQFVDSQESDHLNHVNENI